jgi:hypothetical protein
MMETIISSEALVLTRATVLHSPEDDIHHGERLLQYNAK